jgi:hypothetical protein
MGPLRTQHLASLRGYAQTHCVLPHEIAIKSAEGSSCRWQKQAGAGELVTPERLGCVYAPSTGPDAFRGQLLRSIDSRSADMQPQRNLFRKKGRLVDDSIYRVRISRP